MSEKVRCKRCNRILTSRESIERGYGPTCYRIMQLQEQNSEPNPQKYNQDFNFLKCEIKFLKRQLKELKQKGITATEINSIERIRQDEHRPERDKFKVEFNVVVKELKMIFRGEKFKYREFLRPVAPRDQIEPSPLLDNVELIN